jgi:uncharacterized protein YecT (DUF1311 family)
LLILATALCVPSVLLAQEIQDIEEVRCPDTPMTTIEMRACAAMDSRTESEDLDEVLDSLRAVSANPVRFDSLQAAWVVQRDSTCVEETEEWGMGTIRPQMEADCRTRLTEERVARLREGEVPD